MTCRGAPILQAMAGPRRRPADHPPDDLRGGFRWKSWTPLTMWLGPSESSTQVGLAGWTRASCGSVVHQTTPSRLEWHATWTTVARGPVPMLDD